jgi:hypothetical protein
MLAIRLSKQPGISCLVSPPVCRTGRSSSRPEQARGDQAIFGVSTEGHLNENVGFHCFEHERRLDQLKSHSASPYGTLKSSGGLDLGPGSGVCL